MRKRDSRRHGLDARRYHPRQGSTEIIDVQEETHPACGLLPDGRGLIFPVSSGEQEPGDGTRRPDHDPPLRTPVIRQRQGVFHQIEAQCVHEESDRQVIVADRDRDKAEMHRASIGRSEADAAAWRPRMQNRTRGRPVLP